MIAFCQTIGMVGWRIEGLRPESQKRKLRDELSQSAVCEMWIIRPFKEESVLSTSISSVRIRSVTQSCPTLGDPMNCSMPGLPVHHQLPEFTQLMSIKSVMPSSHLILCRPLLLLPPIPPSIPPNKSALLMRWPKYWSFSFSISPSNEHPGLISFRMDWLDLLAV